MSGQAEEDALEGSGGRRLIFLQLLIFKGGQLSGGQCPGDALPTQIPPRETKSFAVTMYDPDAPTGRGWWHWVIFNIPAGVHELQKDAGNSRKKLAPEGSIQCLNDFGQPGFGGACPPVGDKPHRYVFTVYALNVEKLDLNERTPPAMAGSALKKHTIGKASLISYYGR